MNSRGMVERVRAVVLAACALFLFSASALAGPPATRSAAETPSGSPKPAAKPATTPESGEPDSTALSNGGFALDFSVWKPEGHGDPRRLVITYTWGGSTHEVEAARQNDRWHAEFPTRPRSQEQVLLNLRYEFDLSDQDREKIRAAEVTLLDGILDAVRDERKAASEARIANRKALADAQTALDDAKGKLKAAEEALAAAQNEETSARDAQERAEVTLANATAGKKAAAQKDASDKTNARDEAIRKTAAARAEVERLTREQKEAAAKRESQAASLADDLNVTFAKASKVLSQQPAALTLRAYGSSDKNGLGLFLEALGIEIASDGSWQFTPNGATKVEDTSKLVDAAEQQIRTAVTPYTNAIQAYAGQIAALKPATGDCKPPSGDLTALSAAQAQSLLSDCRQKFMAQVKADAPLTKAAAGLNTKSGEDLAAQLDVLQLEPKVVKIQSFWSMRLAAATVERASRTARRAEFLSGLLPKLDRAFEEGGRKEDGSTLVAGAAMPRRYDVATGALYVFGLDDVIVPSVIAVCGWEGCLAAEEMAWKARNGWWRAVSLDAGIRAATLGQKDPRQSDTIAFVFGLSYNPLSVFRISAGAYAFENAQERSNGSKRWQMMPYAGVTLNVLNAVTILGSIGLDRNLAPSVSAVQH